MKKAIIALSCALVAAGCMSGGPTQASSNSPRSLDDELAGRTAGQTVDCVSEHDLRGNHSAGDAVVFEGVGSTIYVNRPPTACPDLTSSRALRVRTPSSRLCRGDIVTIFDPTSRIEYGSCSLGDFTPYKRTR
jgi:hypothetical protein